jgi:hypothetical protein
MKCYGSGDWACNCKKFEEEKKWIATRFYDFMDSKRLTGSSYQCIW